MEFKSKESKSIFSRSISSTKRRSKKSFLFTLLRLTALAALFQALVIPLLLQHKISIRQNEILSLSDWAGTLLSSGRTGTRNYGPDVIAYAISITGCPSETTGSYGLSDAPAVLAHSIHMNSRRHVGSGSKYDYQLYAFVHPEAKNCSQHLSKFNYTVKILDTPINVSEIKKEPYRLRLQHPNAGCCKEKEFLKLYSLTLHQHPVVVHLDLDTLLVKPMDVLFDAMLLPDHETKDLGKLAMWPADQKVTRRIETFFTRDYPMGLKNWPVEHYGVQGGFWIVRPNQEAFEEMRYLIIEGNFTDRIGWYDGTTRFPAFYGSAMIQGLLNWYYSHLHPGQGIELNRCQFNNMADNPMRENGICAVPSLSGNGETKNTVDCEDCRQTNYSNIFTFHTTFCAKAWLCDVFPREQLKNPSPQQAMCIKFYKSWFRTRYHLETAGWGFNHSMEGVPTGYRDFYGYCTRRFQYSPMNLDTIPQPNFV